MEYGRKFQLDMEYGMKYFWYRIEMEWKKIASIEYRKIVFHSILYQAQLAGLKKCAGEKALWFNLSATEQTEQDEDYAMTCIKSK